MRVLAAAIQSASTQVEPECVATAGLRAGGTTDVIRVTNQSVNESATLQVHFHVLNAAGDEQGQDVSVPIAANGSVSKTGSQIFIDAGLRPFNANYLIQVVRFDASVTPVVDLGVQFQSTYRNSTNG